MGLMPQAHADHIEKIVDLIDSEFELVTIEIVPDKHALPQFCYQNVKNVVASKGGQVQYGWLIQCTPWFLNAMHHAVWENPAGVLVDVTPTHPAMNQALFIPDDRIIDTGEIVAGIGINLTPDHLVDDYLAVEDMKSIILANTPEKSKGSRVMTDPLWYQYSDWALELTKFIVNRSQDSHTCFCSSGIPYESCHGKIIQQSLLKDRALYQDKVVRLPIQDKVSNPTIVEQQK